MKKIIKTLKITSVLLFITAAFIACDKDFTTIESDIQGSENFNTPSIKFPVVAYNKKINAVQTNGLSSNLLGVYKDDVYGLTTASIVTQVTPSSYDPDFGDSPMIESVILTIPYFATTEGTEGEETIYSMSAKDSFYGDSQSKIKLSIYESNYFLRDNNPENIEELQTYYSNANSTINFDNHIVQELLQTEGTLENPHFYPSPLEIVLNEGDDDEERLAPRFRKELNMPTDYWEDLLFNKQDMSELSNANNFKNHFRGLYFKAEAVTNDNGVLSGNMIMLNFSNAIIEINYTNETDEEDENGDAVREDQTFQLNLSGNRLNILENDPSNNIIDIADATANNIEGDDKLHLKGGEGSMAIIDLFQGDITIDGIDYNALEYFKSKKDQWLINEANLVFYTDETNTDLKNEQEPDRIIIYDVNNNVPITDYFLDLTNTSSPENSKTFHSTVLERDSDNNGVKYKIRLTEHLNSILLRDSTNLKLGVMATTNINEVFQASIFNSEDKITSGTVLSPKGTILHGSNESVAEAKRLQLEIFYTCQKEDGNCTEEE